MTTPDVSPAAYVSVAEGTEVALHCVADDDVAGGGGASAADAPHDKPPILFAHAAGLGALTYGPFTQRLAEHFTVWAPDLRGHGWSDPSPDGDYLWTTLADDLLAVVDYLGIPHGSLNCVGHSIGAATLLLAEADRPGLIAKMYGYEPVVWRPNEVVERDDHPLVPGALKRLEVFESRPEAMFRFASRLPFSRVQSAALHSYVEHGFEDLPDGTIRLRCRPEAEANTYLGDYISTTEQIAGLGVPAVIGRGSDEGQGDIGLPAHEALPNSRLIEYKGLSHFGPMEDPERIAADAIAALAG